MKKPKQVNPLILNRVIDSLKETVEKLREDAAYGGRMDDGGAERILDQLDFFLCGFHNEWPKAWLELVKKIEHEEDPEYKTYLKLKKKFES